MIDEFAAGFAKSTLHKYLDAPAITDPNDPTLSAVVAARTKDLPSTAYSYKLAQGNQFGIDVLLPDTLDIDEGRMSVVIPFADGRRRDGVGDLLEVGGIRTERHQANPIVLFDHGKSVTLPIALAEDPDTKTYTVLIDPVSQQACLKAFFYQGKDGAAGVDQGRMADHAVFCEQLFDMTAKRYLRAGSVGYQVIKALNLQPDYERGTPAGLHLLSILMLEGSLVVLPANADTVRKMLCMPKVCGKPLSPYLVKSLQPYAAEKKAQLGYEPQPSPKADRTLPHQTEPHLTRRCQTIPNQSRPDGDSMIAENSGKTNAKSMIPGDLNWQKEEAAEAEHKAQPSDKISPEKAKEVLKDGTVHGHPLTEKQRGMFGAAAGKKSIKELRKAYSKRKAITTDAMPTPKEIAPSVKSLRAKHKAFVEGDRVLLHDGRHGRIIKIGFNRSNVLTVQLDNGEKVEVSAFFVTRELNANGVGAKILTKDSKRFVEDDYDSGYARGYEVGKSGGPANVNPYDRRTQPESFRGFADGVSDFYYGKRYDPNRHKMLSGAKILTKGQRWENGIPIPEDVFGLSTKEDAERILNKQRDWFPKAEGRIGVDEARGWYVVFTVKSGVKGWVETNQQLEEMRATGAFDRPVSANKPKGQNCPECNTWVAATDKQGGQCPFCGWRPTNSAKGIAAKTKARGDFSITNYQGQKRKFSDYVAEIERILAGRRLPPGVTHFMIEDAFKKGERADYFVESCFENFKSLKAKAKYINPLSNNNVPPAKWKPGVGAIKDLRQKHRPTKGLRRRLKKSVSGTSVIHVAPKHLEQLKSFARKSGLVVKYLGTHANGHERVKLMGDDAAMEGVVKQFAVRRK